MKLSTPMQYHKMITPNIQYSFCGRLMFSGSITSHENLGYNPATGHRNDESSPSIFSQSLHVSSCTT
jgi:hypothetical protein